MTISKIYIIWILEKNEEKWGKINIYQGKDYQFSKTDERHSVTNLRCPVISKVTNRRKGGEKKQEGREEAEQSCQLSLSD